MKISTIIGLSLALTCSFSTFAQSDSKLDKYLDQASEIFVGKWEQKCDKVKSTFDFSANDKVKLKKDNKTHHGTWKINDKDKLVLEFNKQDKEKWKITKLTNNKFTITKDKVSCTGKRTS